MKVTALDEKRCESLLTLIDSTVLSSEGVNEVIGTAQVLLWLRELKERFASAVTQQDKETALKEIMEKIKKEQEADFQPLATTKVADPEPVKPIKKAKK